MAAGIPGMTTLPSIDSSPKASAAWRLRPPMLLPLSESDAGGVCPASASPASEPPPSSPAPASPFNAEARGGLYVPASIAATFFFASASDRRKELVGAQSRDADSGNRSRLTRSRLRAATADSLLHWSAGSGDVAVFVIPVFVGVIPGVTAEVLVVAVVVALFIFFFLRPLGEDGTTGRKLRCGFGWPERLHDVANGPSGRVRDNRRLATLRPGPSSHKPLSHAIGKVTLTEPCGEQTGWGRCCRRARAEQIAHAESYLSRPRGGPPLQVRLYPTWIYSETLRAGLNTRELRK